ncbi:hypothetical protein ABZ371_02745 [Streptomyces sp. NPDC005899]|uniref:hypothetical protein n=1 Tax=Streptomyces sp. NPDC005899 TaxID=3155716 RepID=UPI0033FB5C9D
MRRITLLLAAVSFTAAASLSLAGTASATPSPVTPVRCLLGGGNILITAGVVPICKGGTYDGAPLILV